MPFDQVLPKFKRGALKSGSSGKIVKDKKQALAIMLSEKKKSDNGDEEYQPVGPSKSVENKLIDSSSNKSSTKKRKFFSKRS